MLQLKKTWKAIDAYRHRRSGVQFDPVHGVNVQTEAEVDAWESFMQTNSINVHMYVCCFHTKYIIMLISGSEQRNGALSEQELALS
jgi:hypothetical protein